MLVKAASVVRPGHCPDIRARWSQPSQPSTSKALLAEGRRLADAEEQVFSEDAGHS